MGTLDAPAYKVEIRDLRVAQAGEEEGSWGLTLHSDDLAIGPALLESSLATVLSSPQTPRTIHPPQQLHVDLSLVWVQGVVMGVQNSSSLRISDGTGEAVVHDFNTLPGGNHSGIVNGINTQLFANSPL